MSDHQTTICPTCQNSGRILMTWDRPGGPPGNGWFGCPACDKGAAYTAAQKRETDEALARFAEKMRPFDAST